jgi:hypothetical protein
MLDLYKDRLGYIMLDLKRLGSVIIMLDLNMDRMV